MSTASPTITATPTAGGPLPNRANTSSASSTTIDSRISTAANTPRMPFIGSGAVDAGGGSACPSLMRGASRSRGFQAEQRARFPRRHDRAGDDHAAAGLDVLLG